MLYMLKYIIFVSRVFVTDGMRITAREQKSIKSTVWAVLTLWGRTALFIVIIYFGGYIYEKSCCDNG